MKKFSVCALTALVIAVGSTSAFAVSRDCGEALCDCGAVCDCRGGCCADAARCQGGVCGEPVVALTYPEPYDGRERKPRGITIRIVPPPRPVPRIAPPPRPMGPPPRPLPPPRPRW